MSDLDIRRAIIGACRDLATRGLIPGTAGNVSVRAGGDMLITPSGVPYDAMTPEQITRMPLDGSGRWEGPVKPSSEWRFHHDILAARPEDGAVVHTHSPHATAVSMTRQGLPPAHYMIALFGGADVRCADYALFGTQALSDAALTALDGRRACLLANHGAIAVGRDLAQAVHLAAELEELARQLILARQAGTPVLLNAAEIAEARAAFADYGPDRGRT